MDKKLKEKVDGVLGGDCKVSFDEDGVQVEFWSPAGEDMPIYIRGNTIEELAADARDVCDGFDADGHAAQIYHAKHYGDEETQRFYAGAPESLEDLMEDARAIKKSLEDIADKLGRCFKGKGK